MFAQGYGVMGLCIMGYGVTASWRHSVIGRCHMLNISPLQGSYYITRWSPEGAKYLA